jgi:catechol 2,3-dioxygenase-like lactoylglutathione lyase family enzyme
VIHDAPAQWRLKARSIAHLLVEVSDLARARAFYARCLGLGMPPIESWPVADEVCLPLPSRQCLVLKPSASPRTFPESGVHHAYRAAPEAVARIAAALAADGVPVHRYREDRPAEENDPCYFADPDGNRIQLIASPFARGAGVAAIDHAAVQASDMEWIEAFYGERLGLKVDHRVGWSTGDYVRARAWGEGKEDMAPGTRRWDERYRDIPGGKPGQGRRVARPNVQIFFSAGDSALGVFLALAHVQEPPPREAAGSPRVAFATTRDELDRAAAVLEGARVTVRGPVEHPATSPVAASLYVRDPCGNFIELCAPGGNAA